MKIKKQSIGKINAQVFLKDIMWQMKENTKFHNDKTKQGKKINKIL